MQITVEMIKETATRLLSGILSNPNYNFQNTKKAADDAIDHAKQLLTRIEEKGKTIILEVAEGVERAANAAKEIASKVENAADKVGDAVRGSDDDLPEVETKTKKAEVSAKVDPLEAAKSDL